MRLLRTWRFGPISILLLSAVSAVVSAEPYLAVESGLKCNACHTNPTGGGKRSVFGMTYARTQIAARTIGADADGENWNSEVNRRLGVGGDWRGGYREIDPPGPGSDADWGTSKSTVQIEVRAVPDLLSFYVDEQLSPGRTVDREAYALLLPHNGRFTVKAGQFFLPFGLRLQDDASFVRQRSGINFDTPDDGVEFGLELANWSAQLALSNGTAGGGSVSGKDQTSLSAVYVRPRWRLGTSYNLNDDPLGDREMLALFAGWRTGPIAWLAEIDLIEDALPGGGDQEIYATLLEGNWRLAKGQNLKVGYEFLDPSDAIGDDEQERYSIVWEYSPMQLLQTRVGFRAYNGVPGLPLTNRDELFAELHVYF